MSRSEANSVIPKITVVVLLFALFGGLTAAVFRVTEPELQTGGGRMLLAAIRRIHQQPKLLLQRI